MLKKYRFCLNIRIFWIFSCKKGFSLTGRNQPKPTRYELQESQQSLYELIYSLCLVELKTLKTYIKTNLTNGFIRPSKLPNGIIILFIGKLNGSFCLCVDYWDSNNLKIKNQYLLPLTGESLNQFSQLKRFTKLNLTNAYHQMRIKEWIK